MIAGYGVITFYKVITSPPIQFAERRIQIVLSSKQDSKGCARPFHVICPRARAFCGAQVHITDTAWYASWGAVGGDKTGLGHPFCLLVAVPRGFHSSLSSSQLSNTDCAAAKRG